MIFLQIAGLIWMGWVFGFVIDRDLNHGLKVRKHEIKMYWILHGKELDDNLVEVAKELGKK